MYVGLTKKLIEYSKIELHNIHDVDPLFSWQANLIIINGKKSIITVNNRTRMPILFYNVKLKDLKKFDELFVLGIRTVFSSLGLSQEVIDEYIVKSDRIIFGKTTNRSVLTTMNMMTEIAKNMDFYFDDNSVIQVGFSQEISYESYKIDYPYERVSERFYQVFANFIKTNSLLNIRSKPSMKAYQLLIKIIQDEGVIWRRIIVPSMTQFEQLHHIIQASFGWLKYNEYAFIIYHKDEIVTLITDESLSQHHGQNTEYFTLIDYKTPIGNYIELFEEIQYIYDFVVDWRHQIIFEKIIDDYKEFYPQCISGYGTTPEDVTLLNDIKIRKDLELSTYDLFLLENHKKYRKFNIVEINQRLKTALRFSKRHSI
jgi:hypothetical protein